MTDALTATTTLAPLQKQGGRKFILLLLSLAAVTALAVMDKLTPTAGTTLVALFGFYARYNVKQKVDLATAASEVHAS